MSGYSSVPKPKKTPLSTSDNSTTAKAARAGVINVMSGGTDHTGGATLWDGTDFLAWGLNSPNGTPQNKFEEYHTITIPQNIYNDFLNSRFPNILKELLNIMARNIQFLHPYSRIKQIGRMVLLAIVGRMLQEPHVI